MEDKKLYDDIQEIKMDLRHHVKRTDILQDMQERSTSDIKWGARIVSGGVTVGILIIGWLLWLNTTILSTIMD